MATLTPTRRLDRPARPSVRPNHEPRRPAPRGPDRSRPDVATVLRPVIESLLATPLPIRFEFFDGSILGPAAVPWAVHVRSADALRRVIWAPGELGLGRAFVAGDIELEGDAFEVVRRLQAAASPELRFLGMGTWTVALRAARRLHALGLPLPPPPQEARPRGWRHSVRRDASAISHHYDVGNDFYRLVLGPAMTYSCALFADDGTDLESAQAAKHELVCAKLGLREGAGSRLLDVGCGWGSMVLHAAARHRAAAVGITISHEQADLARRRVVDAGLDSRVEIRLQDYRDVPDERFDAISSVGMFEHVGIRRQGDYFTRLRGLLAPQGRLLNHAISSRRQSRPGRRSFMHRYVFPDGELQSVGSTVLAMERAGFEVRDVESLREHYVRTLHAWVANLEAHWEEAVALAGAPWARVWRMYMTGCANRFEDGTLGVHQVLGVATDRSGRSGMPATRREWDRPSVSPRGRP